MTIPFADPAASAPPAPSSAAQVPAAADGTSALKSVGAGSSGVQWVQAANDLWVPKSVVTTAGDLIVATGAGAVGRLAAGAAGTVLRGQGAGVAPAFVADPDVPLATVTTAGDLIVGTGAGAVAPLAAGAAGLVLTGNGAGVAPSYQAGAASLISSQVLGSAVASVTFSSIPATFNHLRLVVLARTTGAVNDRLALQLNGDTGANYDSGMFFNSGAAYASGVQAAATSFGNANSPDLATNTSTAGEASAFEIEALFYAQTSWRKQLRQRGALYDPAGSGTNMFEVFGQWRSLVAVNAISLFTILGASFAINSRFFLYGLT